MSDGIHELRERVDELQLDVDLLESSQKTTHNILCGLVQTDSKKIANEVADAMGSILGRLDSLESENTLFKAKLDSLESENTILKAKVAALESSAATVPVPVVPVQAAATINVVQADAAAPHAPSAGGVSTAAASTAAASRAPPPAAKLLPLGGGGVPPPPPPPPPAHRSPSAASVQPTATATATATETVPSGSAGTSWLRAALPKGMVGLQSYEVGYDQFVEARPKHEIKSQPANQPPGIGVSKDVLEERRQAQKQKREKAIKRLGLSDDASPAQVVEAEKCEEWCIKAGIGVVKTKAELKKFFELDPEVNDFRIQEQVDRWGKMTEEDRAKEEHQRQMILIAQRREDERRQVQAENGDGVDANAFDD